MYNEILTKIADQLGTTVEHLWGVLLRQATISSVVNTILFIGLFVALVWTFKVIRRNVKEGSLEEEGMVICYVGWYFSAMTVCIVFLCLASVIIAGFINPEYWALKRLMGMIGGSE